MSKGYCPYTTVAAVKAADRILGPDRVWTPRDKVQAGWLDRFYRPIAAKLGEIPEIASNATTVAAEHVAFMKKHGWEAQIKACPPGQLLTAGVLDLLVKWKVAGKALPLKAQDGKTYAGAVLTDGIEYWQTDDGKTAACIATKTADRVWLTMVDSAPNQLALADTAQALLDAHRYTVRRSHLHFPMVDLAARETLDWIKDLHTLGQDGKEWSVLEAIQQITLKMNHEGARARAADEIRMGTTSVQVPPPPLVIDKPFLVIFERPGLPQPLFTAYVTQESWKDPGGLGL